LIEVKLQPAKQLAVVVFVSIKYLLIVQLLNGPL